MNFIKKHKHKIILFFAVLLVLALAFWQGGNAPSEKTDEAPLLQTEQASPAPSKTPSAKILPESAVLTETPAPTKTPEENIQSGKSERAQESTLPDESSAPPPAEPSKNTDADKNFTCTLSVRCDTILSNLAKLTPEKEGIVPKDGVIFQKQTVTFYEGESVFNLLAREMKKHKIHLEFVNTPVYNSVYIEGIGNLYEFDCGELSGWMYKVNGHFPNYGCSRYQLKPGDEVEFVYTCDLGADVGGGYSQRNGM